MRPLRRPAGRSWTTTFAMRKRASMTVSEGSSERRRRRITNLAGEDFLAARDGDSGCRLRGSVVFVDRRMQGEPDTEVAYECDGRGGDLADNPEVMDEG